MMRAVRWSAVLVAAVLLLGALALTPVQPAAADTLYGHDISWPQCPESQGGYGLPMPPRTTQFVIVGLTRGLPFTRNPCLADQVRWVTERGKPAHAYTMAGFPTRAQVRRHGDDGPWSATTRAGRLSNVGYAEASYAVRTLRAVGFTAPVVWIDVEPRPAQPWPSDTAKERRTNRYVIEGLMRGLRDAGLSYGLYSYTVGWQEITGSWRLPGVPVWATAGRLDYPEEALDRCRQPSFSGGRVYLSQWYNDRRDFDLTCEPYAFTPLRMPPSSLSNSTAEFDGDWNNDVLARVTSTGALRVYRGDGDGGFLGSRRVATGWGGLRNLETPGDMTGDGRADVLARDPATGTLWLYRGNGRGGLTTRTSMGTGWNVMTAIVGPGDMTGDQVADVVARDSSGNLWLYPGDGRGGLERRSRIGTGWTVMNALEGPGDLTGDGRADLLARERSTGHLWLYPGNGRGGLSPRVRVGTGWNALTQIVGAGDVDGDRRADLLGRDSSGRLWLYPGRGDGTVGTRVLVGTGWNSRNALF
jgi:hypothetical protein